MLVLFLLGGIVLLIFWLISSKTAVDFQSFLHPTLPLDRGIFGVYCFDGKQGSGKSYSMVKFTRKQAKHYTKVYSNFPINGIDVEIIDTVQALLALRNEKNVLIVYDEIFTILSDKTVPINIRDDLTEFLSQQRKMKNVLITSAQEWLQIPIEFRRYVRIQVRVNTMPLGRFGGLLLEEYRNAYDMAWDNLQNEYVAPRMSFKISKYERRYMESYDTFRRIYQPKDRRSYKGV